MFGGSVCMECDTLQLAIKDYCVLCGRTIAKDADRYIERGNYCAECDANIEKNARGTYNLPWELLVDN